jgi:multidrug efflux pump subunit AcrA (membrane-fusion protein)
LVTLRPDIDPVTRTRTAIFEIETENALLFGQTARLMVEEKVETAGLWLPMTSLKEGVRGQWTVLTVDQNRTVRSSSVEVLHAESERVFVRGAFPDGAMLIDEGPQRVTVGQQVAIENAS